MKSKKGFTLIELLAVIVILAVIALIATPLIMNVINEAKKNAAKDSAYGYVKAVENAMVTYMYDKTDASFSAGTITVATGGKTATFKVNDTDTGIPLNVATSGTSADSGSLTVENGVITKGTLTISGFTATFGSSDVKDNGKITAIAAASN